MSLLRHRQACRNHVQRGSAQGDVSGPDRDQVLFRLPHLDLANHSRAKRHVATGPEHDVTHTNAFDRDLALRREDGCARRQALVAVSNDGDVLVLCAQHHHDLVLGSVGVLVLVDQDVLEALLVAAQDVWVVAEQQHGVREQVIEIHRTCLQQAELILLVDLGMLAIHGRRGGGQRVLREQQLVLPLADHVVHAARGEPLRIEVEVADHVTGEPLGIGLVVDAEAAGIAERLRIGPQDADAGRVEGADPHVLRCRPHQVADPLAHLAGGLVREGDGQDPLRMHPFTGDQVGDAVGEHPGLAGTGTCHHQQWTRRVHDRIQLIGVQTREQGLVFRGGIVEQRHGPPSLRTGCDADRERAGAARARRLTRQLFGRTCTRMLRGPRIWPTLHVISAPSASAKSGKCARNSSTATFNSRRARFEPRQRWMPRPKAR